MNNAENTTLLKKLWKLSEEQKGFSSVCRVHPDHATLPRNMHCRVIVYLSNTNKRPKRKYKYKVHPFKNMYYLISEDLTGGKFLSRWQLEAKA